MSTKIPDIQGPLTAKKKILAYLFGSAIFLGVLTTVLVVVKNNQTPEEQRNLVSQTGIDPDFFNLPPSTESNTTTPDILTVSEEAAKKKNQSQSKPKPTPKPKPKKPTAADLFISARSGSVPARHEDPNLSALNYQRRGAVQIRVASGNSDDGLSGLSGGDFTSVQEASEEEKTKADWLEQKDWASYPVKLDRTLTVDRYLPAILINAINSELDGKVVAQIEENVFAAHGRKVLIPAGSKAIGRYNSLTKTGEERLTITWNRIITPEGINIHVQDAEMADAMGRSGIAGDIDKRYFEKYGMSLLVSILTSATSYAIPVENNAEQIVVQQFGNSQASIAKTILDDHIAIKPRITLPAGSRILISPSRDIWFKPPTDNIIYAVPFDMEG